MVGSVYALLYPPSWLFRSVELGVHCRRLTISPQQTCDSIKKDFAKWKMRREYDGTPGGQANTQSIGDDSWSTAKVTNNEDPSTAGPKLAPFYWDVKEGHEKLRERFAELLTLPYFMPKGQPNFDSFLVSPELWFSAPNAGGSWPMALSGPCLIALLTRTAIRRGQGTRRRALRVHCHRAIVGGEAMEARPASSGQPWEFFTVQQSLGRNGHSQGAL